MEKITHLWNVNQLMTKLGCPQSTNLQTFYMGICRKLSRGATLPNHRFGPNVMCSYCGSLWSTIDYKVTVLRGRPVSNSVKRIVKSLNAAEAKVPRVRATLGRKCMRNVSNKLSIKCSICSKSTVIPLSKPKRTKVRRLRATTEGQTQNVQKRKKKKVKDKTAGLIIPGLPKANVGKDLTGSKEKSTKKMRGTTNFITPTQKLKKLNIDRLKDILSQSTTGPKKKGLQKFLTELH